MRRTDEPGRILEGLEPGDRQELRNDLVDRILGSWLAFTRRHLIVTHAAVAIGLALLADRALSGVLSEDPSLAERVGVELALVLVALSIPVLLTLAALRGQFRQIFTIVSDAPGASAPVMLRFVSEELRALERRLDQLRLRGISLAPSEVSEWVRPRCFSATRGRYLATDVCLPSVFMEYYGGYLDAHAAYIEKTGQRTTVRVSLADEEALDVGLWLDELVLRTDFQPDGRIRVTLGIVDEPLYRGAKAYLGAVLREARAFPQATDG